MSHARLHGTIKMEKGGFLWSPQLSGAWFWGLTGPPSGSPGPDHPRGPAGSVLPTGGTLVGVGEPEAEVSRDDGQPLCVGQMWGYQVMWVQVPTSDK